jgi:hypothetical protein
MNKYPQYHTNPDGIIKFAMYNSINGDDMLLDDSWNNFVASTED